MTSAVCGSCGAPTGDGAALCTGCTGKLAAALKLAADIAPDLDDAVARLLRRGGGGKSASAEPPLPVDLAAAEVADALARTLRYWVREMHGQAAGPAYMANWLRERTASVRQHPDAWRMLAGVEGVVDRAMAVVDRKPEMVPVGPCPQCGRHLLAELGSDEALCSCGYWTAGIIARHRDRARKADRLLTPVELSAALKACGYTVAPGTISSWGTRGLIERRAGGYYRLSDALAMAARRQS